MRFIQSGSWHSTAPPSPMPNTLVACRLTTTGHVPGRMGPPARNVSNAAAASITTGTPARRCTPSQAARSSGAPNGDTTSIAPTSCRAANASMTAGSGVQQPGRTSTKCGISPAWRTAPALATNVQDGIRQRDPGRAPPASSASVNALVALDSSATPASGTPQCSASRACNA